MSASGKESLCNFLIRKRGIVFLLMVTPAVALLGLWYHLWLASQPEAERLLRDAERGVWHLLWGGALLVSLEIFLGGLFLSLVCQLVGLERASRVVLIALAVGLIGLEGRSLYLTPARPLEQQPNPDASEYADGARQIAAGNGLVTRIYNDEPKPSRYPPGFSLALAPFAYFSDSYPENVQRGATVYVVLYLLIACAVAWHLGGPLAAALTCLFLSSAPFARTYASLILADGLACVFPLIILGLVHRPTPRKIGLAGFVAGLSVLFRLNLIVNVAALLLALPGKSRKLILWALPGLILLGLHNWHAFGSPLKTGYDYWLPTIKNFAWVHAYYPRADRNTWLSRKTDGNNIFADPLRGQLVKVFRPGWEGDPGQHLTNLAFYPLVLLGFFWMFAPPFTPALGLFVAVRAARSPSGAFTLWLAVFTVVLHIFYFYQGSRFVAPAASVLAVIAASTIARSVKRLASIASDATGDRLQIDETLHDRRQAA